MNALQLSSWVYVRLVPGTGQETLRPGKKAPDIFRIREFRLVGFLRVQRRWLLWRSGIWVLFRQTHLHLPEQQTDSAICGKFSAFLVIVRRVPQLAAEIGLSISEPETNGAYSLVQPAFSVGPRVSFLATAKSNGASASQLELYDRLEDISAVVLRGMRDESFGDRFRDDAQIHKRWPI
jgi:hypothetical protein